MPKTYYHSFIPGPETIKHTQLDNTVQHSTTVHKTLHNSTTFNTTIHNFSQPTTTYIKLYIFSKLSNTIQSLQKHNNYTQLYKTSLNSTKPYNNKQVLKKKQVKNTKT